MYYGLNRTLCDVLNEMRKCHKTRNYSILLSLIEEAQSMGNRMESGLHDISDLREIREELSDARKNLKELQKSISKKIPKKDDHE
jgi:5-bromo-4-chloroindolyl phosphate hydrolysis protein